MDAVIKLNASMLDQTLLLLSDESAGKVLKQICRLHGCPAFDDFHCDDSIKMVAAMIRLSDEPDSKKKRNIFAPDLSFVNPAHLEIFGSWIEYKRQTHHPYSSQRGVIVCYNQLVRMSNADPFVMQQIVEQSIANNYQGLFPVKNAINSTGTKFDRQLQSQQQLGQALAQQCATEHKQFY